MRKRLLILCFGIIVLINSCSVNNSENKIKGKPIVPVTPKQVNWIGHWKNEGYKEQLLYDMARKFEFENQNIVLNLKFPDEVYPSVNEGQFLAAELVKPDIKWDIVRVNNEVAGTATALNDPQWPAKYLVDFSQYEQFRSNSLDEMTSEEKKNRWGGIIPGHAVDGHNFVLWCNKALADEIGINPKLFNMTADDFESYIKAIDDYNRRTNKKVKAFSINSGWLPSYALGLQLFASLVGDYNKLNDESFSSEKVAAWEQVLNYLEKLSAYKPVDAEWAKVNYGTNYSEILNKECLFVINGTWMYNIWSSLDSVNYKNIIPLELPAFNESKTYIGEVSIPWAVPKNALNKEEAVRFMLYWCRPDVADEWVRYTKSPTGIRGSLVQSEFGVDVYENFDYTISEKYSGKKVPLNFDNYSRLFGRRNQNVACHFTDVVSGKMKAREAMNNIRKKLVKN